MSNFLAGTLRREGQFIAGLNFIFHRLKSNEVIAIATLPPDLDLDDRLYHLDASDGRRLTVELTEDTIHPISNARKGVFLVLTELARTE